MAKVQIGNVYPSDEYLLARCAPAGYGLGVGDRVITDFDQIDFNGFFNVAGASNAPVYNAAGNTYDYGWGMAMSRHGEYVAVVYYPCIYGVSSPIRRIKVSGVWQPWEWENPPMKEGVEYRTTARHDGKVVYTKLVNWNTLPNNTEGSIMCATTGATAMVDHSITTKSADGKTFCNASMMSGVTSSRAIVDNGNIGLYITTNTDMSKVSAKCTVWYTKE